MFVVLLDMSVYIHNGQTEKSAWPLWPLWELNLRPLEY